VYFLIQFILLLLVAIVVVPVALAVGTIMCVAWLLLQIASIIYRIFERRADDSNASP
jgi:hypothetical protein